MSFRFETRKIALSIVITFLIFSLSACCKINSCNDKGIIAYVNNEPILESELKREIAMQVKKDPTFKVTPETEAAQLDIMIDRKLLIQKAMERGLAREDRFVNTIRSYWEQTLIRDFLEYKKRSFQQYIFVTEDEIKKYYDKLSERVTFRVVKSKDKNYIDTALDKFTSNTGLETLESEMVGPFGYEDVVSDVLVKAREMPEGGIAVFEEGPYYYLIKVERKESAQIEGIEPLRGEIARRIAVSKEKAMFEEWLKKERAAAKIKILKKPGSL